MWNECVFLHLRSVRTYLKKRGTCSCPLLANSFRLSRCFSSISSLRLSASVTLPSSRSLENKTRSWLRLDVISTETHDGEAACLCPVKLFSSIDHILEKSKRESVRSVMKPLVRTVACVCGRKFVFDIICQFIQFSGVLREAKVVEVILRLRVCDTKTPHVYKHNKLNTHSEESTSRVTHWASRCIVGWEVCHRKFPRARIHRSDERLYRRGPEPFPELHS